MAWQQTQPFNLAKMGKKVGYCLQNVRLAFGVSPKYASAKDAMLANKNAGTLHSINTLPKNVAVPVFTDTASPYEHVEAVDRGTFYSDGKRLVDPYNQKFFGWGETLNGVRIVKWVEDKKSNEQIADEVLAGKWGNGVDRKNRLTAAGYDYNAIQAIVNSKVNGGNSTAIKAGDRVTLIKWVDCSGTALRKTRDYYYVSMVSQGRAVLKADSVHGTVYAVVATNNLRKV